MSDPHSVDVMSRVRSRLTFPRTPVDAENPSAEDRIRRMFARFTSAGFLFYLLILSPSIIGAAELAQWWWTPMALLLVFLPGIGMGVFSFTRDRRWMAVLGGVAAIGYLVSVATWPLSVVQDVGSSGHRDLWLVTFPGVATLAAVLAWRSWLVIVHLVVACVGVQVVNHVMFASVERGPLVADIAFAVTFCAIFVVASMVAVRTGRILDVSRESAQAQAATAAAAAGLMVERERFDGLIHDGVMSTLLATSRSGNTPGLTKQARVTLRQLDRLRSRADVADTFDAAAALALWRSAATEVEENVRILDSVEPGLAGLEIPPEVARGVAAGLAEALRNSVRHADVPGRDVARTVTLAVRSKSLRVTVSDDGRGFDPASVAEHRLGLAVSIRGRMRHLPGGSADVRSRPGSGTTVVFAWDEPT